MGETYDVAVVGTGAIGLAVSAELLARGVAVAVVGPGSGDCPGQATRAGGAMLSTFSEIEPRHNTQHTAVQTTERVAAHTMYPTWLERINNASGARLAGRGAGHMGACPGGPARAPGADRSRRLRGRPSDRGTQPWAHPRPGPATHVGGGAVVTHHGSHRQCRTHGRPDPFGAGTLALLLA